MGNITLQFPWAEFEPTEDDYQWARLEARRQVGFVKYYPEESSSDLVRR